ncbi:unnamed protein product [Rodentolepis nana]|uniref:long-chain-fatty-acid--CoA ligase n=1 Tax=Rodentolepis nana TaxID=102285 RepID=A0A0R3TQ13_RODNA|nr:unnamed protein product [Rodentolepis nana]
MQASNSSRMNFTFNNHSAVKDEQEGIHVAQCVLNGPLFDQIDGVSTLYDLLKNSVKRQPNDPFLGWHESLTAPYQWWTYEQVYEKAVACGSGLLELPELSNKDVKCVGIYASNCPAWIITEFGCWAYGLTVVTLYDTLGQQAMIHICNEAELTVAVCDTPERARKLIISRSSYPELKNIVLVSPQGELERLRTLAAGEIEIIPFDDLLVSDDTSSKLSFYIDSGLSMLPHNKIRIFVRGMGRRKPLTVSFRRLFYSPSCLLLRAIRATSFAVLSSAFSPMVQMISPLSATPVEQQASRQLSFFIPGKIKCLKRLSLLEASIVWNLFKIPNLFHFYHVGTPKGPVITSRNLLAVLAGTLKLFGPFLTKNDVILSFLPLAHIYEQFCEVSSNFSLMIVLIFTQTNRYLTYLQGPYGAVGTQLYIVYLGGRIGFYSGNVATVSDDMKVLRPTVFTTVPRLLCRIFDAVTQKVSKSPFKKFLLKYALKEKCHQVDKQVFKNNSIWDTLVFSRIRSKFGGNLRLVLVAGAQVSPPVLRFMRAVFSCPVRSDFRRSYDSSTTCHLMCQTTLDKYRLLSLIIISNCSLAHMYLVINFYESSRLFSWQVGKLSTIR